MKGKIIERYKVLYKNAYIELYIRYRKDNSSFFITGVEEKDNLVIERLSFYMETWVSVRELKRDVEKAIDQLAEEELLKESKSEKVILYFFEHFNRDDVFTFETAAPSITFSFRVVYKLVAEDICLGYELMDEEGKTIPTFDRSNNEQEVPYTVEIEEFFNKIILNLGSLGTRLEDIVGDSRKLSFHSDKLKLIGF